MTIEPLTNNDLEVVRFLQPPDWSDIVPLHLFYINSSFCFPQKLIYENKIVGIGTTVIHTDTAWLAHIIVNENFRNNGLGTIIANSLIETAKANKKETIYLMATPMGESVYRKLGFVTETEHVFYKSGNINDDWVETTGVIPFQEKFRDQILQLDDMSTGENRASRIQDQLTGSYIYVNKDILEGFYLPDFFEGPITALNPIAGLALMKVRLCKSPIAILPIDNKQGINFLTDHNFKAYRKAWRMRLGKEREWHPEFIYNRVSGQIG